MIPVSFFRQNSTLPLRAKCCKKEKKNFQYFFLGYCRNGVRRRRHSAALDTRTDKIIKIKVDRYTTFRS